MFVILRNVLAVQAMLFCLWGYYYFTWLVLPEKTTAGRYDSYFLLCLLACAFCLAQFRSDKTRIFFLLGWVLCVILVPLSWWNYAFYQDGLVWSSLLYGTDAMQGSKAIMALGHLREAAIGGAALVLGMLSALYWLPREGRCRRCWLIGALLFALAAGLYSYKFQDKRLGIPLVSDSHPVLAFFRSAFDGVEIGDEHVAAIQSLRHDVHGVSRSDFPLYHHVPAQKGSGVDNAKNVILVVLESMRASETGVYGGQQHTPNLDRVARKALKVSDFYANSIQTVRGEMSLLCGVLDLARGAPYANYGNPVKNRCLPEILRDFGYQTHWFHGYERAFFKRDTFLPSVGFNHIHDRDVIREKHPDAEMLGWGVADENVFDYALDILTQEQEPFFAEILTLSNHYPFDWNWGSLDWPEGQERGVKSDVLGNYHTGIRYTDYAFGRFWDAFSRSPLSKNTALFVVGDHGIWLFDEDQSSSSFLKHEKYYRVPMLMVLPDEAPGELDMVASQVDVPPTVLSYLGIAAPTAFLGADMLTDKRKENRFAVMLKNGAFGFRSEDTYCYPKMAGCDSASDPYQRCQVDKAEGEMMCVSTNGRDMLRLSNERHFSPVEKDTDAVKRVIEYMNTAHLREGFFPSSAEGSNGSLPKDP